MEEEVASSGPKLIAKGDSLSIESPRSEAVKLTPVEVELV